MQKLTKDKWLDIKMDLLEDVDYDFDEEDLFYFDERSRSEIRNGKREIYLFEKNGMEVKFQVDIVPRMERHEGTGKGGSLKVSYEEVPDEMVYKLSIFVKDATGVWRDSSAFEQGSL